MSKDCIQSARGMYDILPENYGYWRKLKRVFSEVCEIAGFGYIETPAVENKDLFIRSVGKKSEIVNKELFGVTRLSEDKEKIISNVLRPEGTAGIVRSYIENGMQSQSQPVKLYYQGSFWRYERPQAGRFRQFYQLGMEIIGDDNSESDAYIIMLAYQFLQKLGLSDKMIIEINTIGDSKDRPVIIKSLKNYFKPFLAQLPEDAKNQYEENILRILDSKDPMVQKLLEGAPQIMDMLSVDSHKRFKKTLEALDELEIEYILNPHLVRGFDYYTHIVFEIRDSADENRQASIGGGGRYNSLVKELGGPDIGAIGCAFGAERIIEKLKSFKITPDIITQPKVYLIQIGEKAKKKCLNIVYRLNQFNIPIAPILGERDSLRSQLKFVDKQNAPIAVIIGQKEALEGTAIIRNMKDGVQETVDFDELILKLQDSLDIVCS